METFNKKNIQSDLHQAGYKKYNNIKPIALNGIE